MSDDPDKYESNEVSDGGGNGTVTDGLEISEPVQAAGKKRNRRKERPRRRKANIEADLAIATSTMESLNVHSSHVPNGTVVHESEVSSADHLSKAINLDSKAEDVAEPSSPSKRRNRKKKNVALASIEKLGYVISEQRETVSSLDSAVSSKNPNGMYSVKSTSISKVESKNNRRPPRTQESEAPSKQSSRRTSERKPKPSPQVSQPPASLPRSPLKQKPKQSGGFSTNSGKTDESLFNENKFERHIQREQAEIMLKTGQISAAKGFVRINQRNFREAYISNPDGSRDILIDGVKDRNRALEGDEVVVFILPPSVWRTHEGVTQKVGKVVHILTQVHHRQAVGTLKKMQDGNSRLALFSPRDSRIPRMRIPMNQCPKNHKDWDNCLFYARICQWTDVRFAMGQLIGDSFGAQGDVEAETRAILLDNEIDVSPYEEKLHVYFPEPPYIPSEDDIKGREDLRKCCIFTIDPLTAKDLDDAVSCVKLENGNYKVGVHISDVSYFLREGTPLDVKVSKRATTTYLVQRAYHMLPREMTMMCSLLPGEDKLAFSVFWEITPEAEVISHYFTRSIIRSCAQLAYEHAQIMIDDPDHNWLDGELPKIYGGWTVKDLKEVVLSLQYLAAIMRKRRFDGGALRVDQTKLMFNLNGSGEPISFSPYVNKESHRLIEEFMLLANMTVATDLHKKFPLLAFLRCHQAPHSDMLDRLAELLVKFGIVLDTSSAGSLHQSLQQYQSTGDRARYVALTLLCSKPMIRARYFCAATMSNVDHMRHYALNAPLYTHFTSPIRRYADVMVHRLLSAFLGYSEEPKWTVDYVNEIAANCNKMKFCAKKAGEQSTELFLALWVRKHGTIEEEVVVVDVKDRSFDAVVCSSGTNVRVYTDKLSAAVEFENDSVPELKITWAIAGGRVQQAYQVITMFSVVRVALRTSNTNLLKLEATLLPPSE